MIKNKIKFLLFLGIILSMIFIFNVNTSNATEITEDDLQKIIDALPDTINLDIPEIECEKADDLLEQQVKEILTNKDIDIKDIELNAGGTKLYYEDIHSAEITIESKTNGKQKQKNISVEYNNSNKKNKEDEQYVKNIAKKLKSPKYYEVELDFYTEKSAFDDNEFNKVWNKYLSMILDYYTKQVNDSSVTIKVAAGAGGSDGTLNVWTFESGTIVGIFKNGVLYDIKRMGEELTVPVINVPDTVSDDEVEAYVKKQITKSYKTIGEHITKIEKGTKNKETYGIDFDIHNGYTIYSNPYGYMDTLSYVIINRNKSENTDNNDNVIITDDKSNIKMEANNNVIPSNANLVVTQITDGTTYNRVKKMISSANKFKLYNITLESDGVEIQADGKLKISIPIPDEFDASKIAVYRMNEDDNTTEFKINTITIDGIKYVEFETEELGKFVLVELNKNNNEKDGTPKTGRDLNVIPCVIAVISMFGIVLIMKRK